MSRTTLAIILALLGAAADARAQEDQWGISVGLTPSWQTGDPVKALFRADQIDMQGSEVRIGVVRGISLGGDWGFSFVNKTIEDDSTLDVDVSQCSRGSCGTFYRTMDQTRLTGLEFHQYQPFRTWRERVQLGMVGAVGVGWLRGRVSKRTITEEGDVESFDANVGELFPPSTSVVPLARLEIVVAGIVMPSLKVRAGGGFSMPGYHTFAVTVMYLIP
jgi:hypothetical protein